MTQNKNRADLINDIEDMLMEELYENNRRNSQQQFELNHKFVNIFQVEDVDINDDNQHNLSIPQVNHCIIQTQNPFIHHPR